MAIIKISLDINKQQQYITNAITLVNAFIHLHTFYKNNELEVDEI